MNLILLHGRLTRDPEMSTTAGGIETCKFTVAVNRPVGKDKEKQVDFIPCKAWRQTAAFIAKYFKSGDGIVVDGSLQVHKFDDKDGQKRTFYEVQVNRAEFAEKRQGDGAGASNQAAPSNVETPDGFTDIELDDPPF